MSQTATLPLYACPRVADFEIDGDLEKPVWSAAQRVLLLPASGKKETLQKTHFAACWSEKRLYVAFSCADTHLRTTHLNRDDALYNEDVTEVFLCPSNDLTRYFEFEFSPRAVIFDAKVRKPDLAKPKIDVDTDWNSAGLQCLAKKQGEYNVAGATGWSVEIAIPFADLERPTPKQGEEWRANFYRIDYETPTEYSAWSPVLTSPVSYHTPERFGRLRFDAAPKPK